MINNQCEGSVMFGGGVDRHVKVTLPGIPKRRYCRLIMETFENIFVRFVVTRGYTTDR